MSIVSRENIISEKVQSIEEGKLLPTLFDIAEEIGIEEAIVLENNVTFSALEYVKKVFNDSDFIRAERVYAIVLNIYYIIELYLRGYYAKESYMKYEEFLNLVKMGKAGEIITAANEAFVLHMNRLKKIIAKSKKKIPRGDLYYKDTLELLKELDKDISICAKYPNTSIDLTEFYFARWSSDCGPVAITHMTGVLAFERYIYSLYDELCILSKISIDTIHDLCDDYTMLVGNMKYNLFEKVINNYLFSLAYSDESQKGIRISKVDAELLMNEIKLGTLNAKELVDQLIDILNLEGYKKEYMEKYEPYLQKRIDGFREMNYFAELFIISPY